MKLRYETGIAALIQFLIVVVLTFFGSVYDMVASCFKSGGFDCVSNILSNLALIILTALWFGFLGVLAFAAQDKRNYKLARLLILCEVPVLLVALFDTRHYHNLLGLVTSVADACLAIWVMWLAYRLSRAKGGRITGTSTRRPRRRPAQQPDKPKVEDRP